MIKLLSSFAFSFNLRRYMEERRFFAKPKLALDCVGGASAAGAYTRPLLTST
jgi:hypothetical protein